MKASFDARQAILARIRSATQGAEKHAYANLPRTYIRHGKLPHPLVSELMIERLREYGADVVEAAPAELPAVLVRQLQSSGRSTFVAPPGLPVDRLAPEIDWKIDMGLTHDQVEQCDGVVTAAFAGVADSGTIVLHHSAAEGRRLITLLLTGTSAFFEPASWSRLSRNISNAAPIHRPWPPTFPAPARQPTLR